MDLSSLLQDLTDAHLPQLSRALGADEHSAKSAVAMAMPALLAALHRNASKPGGAESLLGALDRDHDGSVLDDLGSVFAGKRMDDGNGILRHALGEDRSRIEAAIGKKSGLDIGKVSKLMAMVAPLVMGYLGRQRRQGHLQPGSLGDVLRRQGSATAQKADVLGGLGRLIDRDGDGNVLDDLGGLANILGGMLGRR